MIAGSIGHRYAKALLEVGREHHKVDDYLRELELFREVIQSSSELTFLLTDPVFEVSPRKHVLGELAKKLKLSKEIHHFLEILIERERMVFFEDIFASYQEQADEELKRIRVQVMVSEKLASGLEGELKKIIERLTQKTALMKVVLNPDLLGGMVIKIKDTIFDGSIKTALVQLKEKIMEVPLH